MKTVGQMQAFLGNGDQHVCADRNPYLRLDRVLVGAIKRLDPKVLLDPFEKQFDLPALAIQICNQFGFEGEVVGQKCDALASVVLDHHTSQRGWIVLAGIKDGQHTRLIAHDVRAGSVHGVGVTPLELGIGLGTGDEEGLCLMHRVKALEVQIAAIHDVEGAWLQQQNVEHIHIPQLAIRDMDKAGDVASQVEQRVHLHRRLGRAKQRPREERQTQIDGRRVQRVGRILQLDTKIVADIELSRLRDQ